MADMSSGQQFTLGLLNTLGQAFISYKAIDEGIQLQEGFTPRISTVSMNEQVQPVGLGKDLGTTAAQPQ